MATKAQIKCETNVAEGRDRRGGRGGKRGIRDSLARLEATPRPTNAQLRNSHC